MFTRSFPLLSNKDLLIHPHYEIHEITRDVIKIENIFPRF